MMEVKRLFVGGLFKDITENTLRERFSKFGIVSNVELKHKYEPSSSGAGEWLKSFAFVDLQTTPQDFNKCVQVLGKARWKGHSLRIEEAGVDFMTKVKNEIAHAGADDGEALHQPENKDDGHGTPYPPSQPAAAHAELRGATPGTVVPGAKNWVVTKFARPVPVVYIRRKDKKKVMKYDPSKYCHQLKKLEGKDSASTTAVDSTSVASLTWSLPEVSSGKQEQQRRELDARAAAVIRRKPGSNASVITTAAPARTAAVASTAKKRQRGQSSGSDAGLSSDDSSDRDGSSNTGGDDVAATAVGFGSMRNPAVASRGKPLARPLPGAALAVDSNVAEQGSDAGDIEIVPMSNWHVMADDSDSGADTDDILSSQPITKAATLQPCHLPKVATTRSSSSGPSLPLPRSTDSEAQVICHPPYPTAKRVTVQGHKQKSLANGIVTAKPVCSGRLQPADSVTAPAVPLTPTATKKKSKTATDKLNAATSEQTLAAAYSHGPSSAQAAVEAICTGPAGDSDSTHSSVSIDAAPAPLVLPTSGKAGNRRNDSQAKVTSRYDDSSSRALPTSHAQDSDGQLHLSARNPSPAKCDRPRGTTESNGSSQGAKSAGTCLALKSAEVKNVKEAAVDQKPADGVAAAAKHEISNQRRLETIKEKQMLAKIQQQKIKSALKSLDASEAHKAKHITFESDEDEDGTRRVTHQVAGSASTKSDEKSISGSLDVKKAALFESDSDSESAVDSQSLDKAFEPKPQFEGKKGEKLMKMQARFDNDDRFRLTELFMEDEASEDSDEENGEDDEVVKRDEKVDVEVSSKAEKQRNLSILRGIVGDKRVGRISEAPKPKIVASNMLMTRYDPTDVQHKSLELTVEPKKKKPRKSHCELNGEAEVTEAAPTAVLPPAPEVSKDRFFDVRESLADLFAKKDAATFSFFDESATVDKPSLGDSTLDAVKNDSQATQPWMRNYPEARDSSDDEESDGDDSVTVALTRAPAGDSQHAVKPTESGQPITALVDSFFFLGDDPRLEEGRQFCRSLTIEQLREQWLQSKEELTQDYRQQRKRVLRKLRSKGSSAGPPWKRQAFAGADRRRT